MIHLCVFLLQTCVVRSHDDVYFYFVHVGQNINRFLSFEIIFNTKVAFFPAIIVKITNLIFSLVCIFAVFD